MGDAASVAVSVVVVTYRRLERLPEILAAWLAETPDVWLCDCSAVGATGLPTGVKVVRFTPDPGSHVWHAVATLTAGECVIKACDDVMPQPGLVADLLAGQRALGGMVGVYGRTINGPRYYHDTTPVAGNAIATPTRVGFLGNVTLSPRRYLALDLRGCVTQVEDLYWTMHAFADVPKWVIPTKRYVNLPESQDAGCLYHNPEAREIRARLFAEYYHAGEGPGR